MDKPPPSTWRLDWRNYAGHHTGKGKPPPTFHKRFRSEAAARQELARLCAIPDAKITGFVAEVPGKPLQEQTDFAFPLGDGRRLTD
jgi:hypothetical protein